jgi:hypothetical protein
LVPSTVFSDKAGPILPGAPKTTNMNLIGTAVIGGDRPKGSAFQYVIDA